MTENRRLPDPSATAPKVVADLFMEFVCEPGQVYDLMAEEGAQMALPDFQMETLIFGLHCLDRAIFNIWGSEYRSAFMESALLFASRMMSEALPEPARHTFIEQFQKHYNQRQIEYGGATLSDEAGTAKGYLPYEFAKSVSANAGVQNPVLVIILMEWANGICSLMLKISESLGDGPL